jgi:SAM-dependent methyltransferase
METSPTAYDTVSYPGGCFPQTHPDRLATVATLYGLSPAPPGRCRFLELGCAEGANLIAMAYDLPGSEFVGLDLAASAVAAGKSMVEAMGLRNISLRHADVAEATDLGSFDYVVAHGLFSWVPREVQERILSLCQEVLAPHGVAYISYNAYPGCHVRNAVRQMMRWHVRDIEDPAERVSQARGLIRYLGEAAPPLPVLAAILKETLELQEKQQDAVLFHDDLAEVNEPFLFIDFVGRAAGHGLRFLAEADAPDMAIWDPDSPSGRLLRKLGAEDVLLEQQYRDFLTFRKFRQTLLCRAEVAVTSPPDPERLHGFWIAAPTRPVSDPPDVASDAPLSFTAEVSGEMSTPHRLSKAAFVILGEKWPAWLPCSELVAASRARLAAAGAPPPGEEDEQRFRRFLLGAYGAGIVEIRSRPCPFVTELSEHPRASALARHQAASRPSVINRKHQTVRLDDALVRRLLELLDGTRDVAAVQAEMERVLHEEGAEAAGVPPAQLAEGVRRNLKRVARLALLEA